MAIIVAAEASGALLARIFAAGGRVLGGVGGRVITAETGKKITQVILKSGNSEIILDKEASKDKDKQDKCNKCEAYMQGFKTIYLRNMGDRVNADYQFDIANLSSIPLTFSQYKPFIKKGNTKETTPIEEWKLQNVGFDGLWPIECFLVEAKGKYAQFLSKNRKPNSKGEPDIFMEKITFDKLLAEARSHRSVVQKFKKVQLSWYFAEKDAKAYFDSRGGSMLVRSIYFPKEYFN